MKRSVRELIRLVGDGEAEIIEDSGAFLLATGELFSFHGKPVAHGPSAYMNQRCRCDECRTSMARKQSEIKRRRRIPEVDPWANVRTS